MRCPLNYQCLKQNDFADSQGYQIRAIRQEDMEAIRIWRNAQIDILRQKIALSQEMQQDYFQQYLLPTFSLAHPPQILLSFLFEGQCIGYGGLTHLDWENERAEVSFLVDTLHANHPTLYAQDLTHFLNLLCQLAFDDLHLHRLYTETFAFRYPHIKILEHFGFKKEGILRDHVFKRNQWFDSMMHGLLAQEWNHAQ